MNELENIVQVTITRNTQVASMQSFNEHLVVSEFEKANVNDFATRLVNVYQSAKEMIDAGFRTTDFAYRSAVAQFAQSPHIRKIYVGYKDKTQSWAEALNAIINESNEWYALTCDCRNMKDLQEIADFVSANEKIAIFASGEDALFEDSGDIASYLKNKSVDRVAVIYHPNSKAKSSVEQKTVTVYAENESETTTFYEDVAKEKRAVIPSDKTPQKTSAEAISGMYTYTYQIDETINSVSETDECIESAWLGKMLTKQPGSATYALKTLQNVSAYSLTSSKLNKLRGKNCNTYMSVAGINITQNGQVASGEYIDVVQGIDYLKAKIQNEIFTVLAQNDKIPYTDSGVQMIIAPLKTALDSAVSYGILSEYDVEFPEVANVSQINKGNRLLPDINFTGTLAGAIHATQINGVVSL